jgi:hypothetical protein
VAVEGVAVEGVAVEGAVGDAVVEEAMAVVVAASVRGREVSDISPFPRGCGNPGSEGAEGGSAPLPGLPVSRILTA